MANLTLDNLTLLALRNVRNAVAVRDARWFVQIVDPRILDKKCYTFRLAIRKVCKNGYIQISNLSTSGSNWNPGNESSIRGTFIGTSVLWNFCSLTLIIRSMLYTFLTCLPLQLCCRRLWYHCRSSVCLSV